MRAIAVSPGHPHSARLIQIDPPQRKPNQLLIQTLMVGICGTDREIIAGGYGEAPEGDDFLILGHESLGQVVEAPGGCGFQAGDLVTAIVRQPDPVPCPNCAIGEWDMCRNGLYTEHGIKKLHGFGIEQFCIAPEHAVKLPRALKQVGVLTEPASILAKAWEHIERIGQRARWQPARVLVTGAGPIGLLAALMGVQRGYQVHVLDRVVSGPKPDLVRDLGASYHTGDLAQAGEDVDIVIECTGVAQLVFDAMSSTAPNGIVCLTGISSGTRELSIDMTAWNRSLVLENDVVFGSVNANRRHYQAAVDALARADRSWLERLVSRKVPLENWEAAFERMPDDVKTVIQIAEG